MYLRISLEILLNPKAFAGTSPAFRVTFVHWWHDVRTAEVPGGGLVPAAGGVMARVALWGGGVWVFQGVLLKVVTFWVARDCCLACAFVCQMHVLDEGYRLPLLLATGRLVPPAMSSPWRSRSLREFWSQRWNRVIQVGQIVSPHLPCSLPWRWLLLY
jgi:hypothetical protein